MEGIIGKTVSIIGLGLLIEKAATRSTLQCSNTVMVSDL